jgi:hypothetical protein
MNLLYPWKQRGLSSWLGCMKLPCENHLLLYILQSLEIIFNNFLFWKQKTELGLKFFLLFLENNNHLSIFLYYKKINPTHNYSTNNYLILSNNFPLKLYKLIIAHESRSIYILYTRSSGIMRALLLEARSGTSTCKKNSSTLLKVSVSD